MSTTPPPHQHPSHVYTERAQAVFKQMRVRMLAQLVLGLIFIPAFFALTVTIFSHHHDDSMLIAQYSLVIVLSIVLVVMGMSGFMFMIRSNRDMQDSVQGHREREIELGRSISNLQMLLDNTGLAFTLYNINLELIAWNSDAERFTALFDIPQPRMGLSLSEWHSPAQLENYELLKQKLLNGDSIHANYAITNANTEQTYAIDYTYNPVRSANGQIIAFCCVTKDVTEQYRAERVAHESDEMLHQIADNVNEILFVREWKTRKYLYISKAYERIYQRPVQALLDDPEDYFVIMHPDDIAEVRKAQQAFADAPAPYSLEYRIVLPDGSLRWIRAHSFCVNDNDGNLIRTVGIAEDITRFKTAEKQAVELALERERMRLLSDFIRGISHEFRTPLATIHSGLYLLRRTTSTEDRERRIDGIEEQAKNILRLVEDMVTMTRLENEKLVRAASLNVRYIVEAAVDGMRPFIERKNLQLTVEIPPDLAPIQGDGEQIRRMLVNLLTNAIRYTQPEGLIIVRCGMDDGKTVVIDVQDTGIGIAEKEIDRIWELFYRSETAQSTSGFGLGLPVAKRIAELHGGSISVSSKQGEGSTFRVSLPVSVAAESPSTAQPQAAQAITP